MQKGKTGGYDLKPKGNTYVFFDGKEGSKPLTAHKLMAIQEK
jgi:hypothetical protein